MITLVEGRTNTIRLDVDTSVPVVGYSAFLTLCGVLKSISNLAEDELFFEFDAAEVIRGSKTETYGTVIVLDGDNKEFTQRKIQYKVVSAEEGKDVEEQVIRVALPREEPYPTPQGGESIKDGMVEKVEIVGDKLIITWNSDAGIPPTEIPLSQIFNPDNYYDKSTVDNTLSRYVLKETGKGLSTNDYTTPEKNKLTGVEEAAQKNVKPDWNAAEGSAEEIKNKPPIPTVPAISTNITSDATSNVKTTSPKAVKTFVEGKGYATQSQLWELRDAIEGKIGREELPYEMIDMAAMGTSYLADRAVNIAKTGMSPDSQWDGSAGSGEEIYDEETGEYRFISYWQNPVYDSEGGSWSIPDFEVGPMDTMWLEPMETYWDEELGGGERPASDPSQPEFVRAYIDSCYKFVPIAVGEEIDDGEGNLMREVTWLGPSQEQLTGYVYIDPSDTDAVMQADPLYDYATPPGVSYMNDNGEWMSWAYMTVSGLQELAAKYEAGTREEGEGVDFVCSLTANFWCSFFAITEFWLPEELADGRARDFVLRLDLTGADSIDGLAFIGSERYNEETGEYETEEVTFETEDGTFPVPTGGKVNLLAFTETAPHTFAVSCREVEPVEIGEP